jgi:hypothetical protein
MAEIVAAVSSRRHGFDSGLVRVRFMVNTVFWDRFFSEYFSFPLSVSIHQYSVFVFIYMLLLPVGKTGETWEPSIQ